MDWQECNDNNFVKKVMVDNNLIKSLLKSSDKKQKSQELLPLNEITASSKISLAYDALRELLEGYAILKGYKIYNHECYCAFLGELLEKKELSERFNKLRKVRNAINYYGKDVNVEEAKYLLLEIKKLIDVLFKNFKDF
jgi:hypothetical protein